jgi:hypothetical protein
MLDSSDSCAVLRPVACLDDGSLLLEDLAVDDLAVEAGVLDGASCPVLHRTRELCFTIFSSSSVHGGSLIFVIPVNICVGRPREDGMSLLTSVCVVVNMYVLCYMLFSPAPQTIKTSYGYRYHTVELECQFWSSVTFDFT